jgi:hypothetical protein
MGELSRQLHQKLKHLAAGAAFPRDRKDLGAFAPPDAASLIADGFDPVHCSYLLVHHLASVLAVHLTRLSELRDHDEEVEQAKNRYNPQGPPASPLTASYFQSWSLFDHPIGNTIDTLADCVIEASDIFRFNPNEIDVLKKLSASRMGIYEHQGLSENYVKLRELITNQEFVTHVPSGYRGRSGELWFVRLLPPLLPELATYHVAFTTPYVLMGATRSDWILFLRRNIVITKAPKEEEALCRFMKVGSSKNYWNEFVYLAYHHALPNAVFLAGIPDLRSTLPRGER